MLKEIAQETVYKIINPLVKLLVRMHVTPNAITTIGLCLNIAAAIVFIIGAEFGERGDLSYVGIGGAVILFAGLFDMLDGQVARIGKMTSRFGALYDSVLDRYSELIMFLGICYYLVSQNYFMSSLIAFMALIGSMMVSYTRARAEGLGIQCTVGLMQRPERVVIIGISAIACGIISMFIGGDFKYYVSFLPFYLYETITFFTFPILIVAILSNYTAIDRLRYCKKELENKN
ncbi:MAG: CDP-alcohol phosphatidyltransferase family protein [Bacteroidia bacterium]